MKHLCTCVNLTANKAHDGYPVLDDEWLQPLCPDRNKLILGFQAPSSGQGAGGEARTRDRRVPADLRADSLATEPPTPLFGKGILT
ncbi:hypothetical protein PoB_004802100 [Plakobranchus ocellatus]|uniref:Uncharacterized protein n=1 Tax=Plakobranchus ocellatus TaxID=259542 RepID=A0AAV4BM41_9GAST|nr:hypothetical protein PoB_004802100 [Plakobranchus ocellatus]